MIPNQWYAVLESREVPRGKPIGATRLGERLVFWREGRGKVACLRDLCVHRGAMLSAGKLCGDRVQCPFHGFEYDRSGRCTKIPAHGHGAAVPERFRVRQLPAREEHGWIFVWWGELPGDSEASLPPVPFFDDIDDSFSTATAHQHWAVHYSRAVENQLDVMHLPFPHHNTIGRGGKVVVDGPIVEWLDTNKMRFYVFNRRDDGTPARKAEELDRDTAAVHLDFVFPNLWQNHLGDKLRITAAFVPVDEGNCVVYIRLHQKILRVPLLRSLFNWVMMRFNGIILSQDRRVVLTQQPVKTSLKMGELLVQGDRPIALYRQRRQELIGD